MARPRKLGLDYFPFDVDFFHDEKIVAVAGEFGLKGEIAAIKLLCAIYRNGYFIEWNEMVKYMIASQLNGVSAELLEQIVSRLVKWGFFDKSLFDSANVLSSRAIQTRYFEAARFRKLDSEMPHLLVEPKSYYSKKEVSHGLTNISQWETPVSHGFSTQSKVNNNKKPTDVGKKGFDPPPPSTKKSFEFKSLKAQTEELCSDSSWLSVVSEATGLDSEEIAGLVRGKFLKHCVAEGKDHDGQTSDAKSHFVRWFRRQNEEKKNPNEASGARKAGLTKAEARAIEDLERLKRNETWEKEKLNRQSPADYIRSLGYDPEKVSLKQVMQPEWRRENPPKPI